MITYREKDPSQPTGYTEYFVSEDHPLPVRAATPNDFDAIPVCNATPGGGSTTVAWDDVTDKPDYIAAGATAAAARTAIGAGTSSLGLGTGPTTAAPGDHTHANLPAYPLPATLGTPGQVLAVNSTGDGLEWIDLP